MIGLPRAPRYETVCDTIDEQYGDEDANLMAFGATAHGGISGGHCRTEKGHRACVDWIRCTRCT